MTRGKLFLAARFFVRLKIGRWTAHVPAPEGPTAYVCHHGNFRGPLTTLCWLPFSVRPWVLAALTERGSCRAQFRDFTFTRRFGMPRWLGDLLAVPTAAFVSALTRSAGAIPVHRGSVKIGQTFKASVAALQAGDPVLIFPDVDYASDDETIGAVYDGFLLLDRFWKRQSDVPLTFVPLRLDQGCRTITAGEPVQFDHAADQKAELQRVREHLRAEINRT